MGLVGVGNGVGVGVGQCEHTISTIMNLYIMLILQVAFCLQRYSQSCRTACRGTERPQEVIPAGSSHWQPMDTFLFHRNYTRQTSGTAVNRETTGFVNSTVILQAKSHVFNLSLILQLLSGYNWGKPKLNEPLYIVNANWEVASYNHGMSFLIFPLSLTFTLSNKYHWAWICLSWKLLPENCGKCK